MTSKEFVTIRKKLTKTQREIASLLGISLKAVCSYEQGWRMIPNHVERQLFFLLSQKLVAGQQNPTCWEIKNCPDEKKHKCPAWEFNSGHFCWFINGNSCDNTTHKNWDEKLKFCKKCVVMKKIK